MLEYTTMNKYNLTTMSSSQVELLLKFFEANKYKSHEADLYKAITCYRLYDSLDEFLNLNPELEPHKDEFVTLWAEFSRLTGEELAEVALELLVTN